MSRVLGIHNLSTTASVDASYLGIRRTPVWSPEVVGWAFFYPHLIDHSESY